VLSDAEALTLSRHWLTGGVGHFLFQEHNTPKNYGDVKYT
jgi:hypothetical protein